jgi:16S rRNA (cytidine1402-2'-O)-methyltransferase
MAGVFYIVSTPIGNLQDITFRALETLRKVDMILCEDTRRTSFLLNSYDIKKQLISCYQENIKERMPFVIEQLLQGKSVALVSDSGTPCISDPGYMIVKEVIKNNIPLTVIPGPSAIISALVVSGLPTDSFVFCGFLGKKRSKIIKEIAGALSLNKTVVFYESPHRLLRTLSIIKTLSSEIKVAVVRELTKKFEEVIRGKIEEVIDILNKRGLIKGEIVVVLSNERGNE